MKKSTTKVCPECGNTKLWEFPYSHYKVCDEWSKHITGTVKVIPWKLDEGQQRKY